MLLIYFGLWVICFGKAIYLLGFKYLAINDTFKLIIILCPNNNVISPRENGLTQASQAASSGFRSRARQTLQSSRDIPGPTAVEIPCKS